VRALIERLLGVFGLLLILTLSGTVGFRLIEGWSWGDSVYMTVITLSTVGFMEAHPLSGPGRLFTVILILAGTSVALYLLSLAARIVLDGQMRQTYLRERMAMRIRKERGHVIVGGYGRYGRAVVEELLEAGKSVVVMDPNEELRTRLEAHDLPFVIASAASDEGLIEAGIEGASAIVAATPSEADNVFITLAAKELNPQIRVHARCESASAARRLTRAGADQTVMPFQMGGARTAASILRPAVVDFLEILSPRGAPEVDLEQIVVAPGSDLVGLTLVAIEGQLSALRIVALRRGERTIRIAPSSATAVEEGDLLVVIGEREPLLELAARAGSPEA
jgi:voltage-gated potassium channel